MKRTIYVITALVLCACSGKNGSTSGQNDTTTNDSLVEVTVKYATGFTVRDSADVRFVEVGKKDRFALVHSDDTPIPANYIKVRVPIYNTICMTALQLSNFTALNAHDVVKGITGTKNLFNQDILQRVKDGQIVKIGHQRDRYHPRTPFRL